MSKQQITELTDAQKARIPSYQQKWEKIGKEYKKIDQAVAIPIIKEYLALADIHPTKFYFYDSPYACEIGINMVKLGRDPYSQPIKGDNIEPYSLGYWFQSGNIQAGYCAFYDFLIEEVVQPDADILNKWYKFRDYTEHFHYIFVFDDVVFCSEKPLELHYKGNNLHKVDGPAVLYGDGYALYMVEGVNLGKDIVMSKPEDIPIDTVLKETNAEKRMAILAKIGIENFIERAESTTIEEISALELYKKYPIGCWYQHGDVLIKNAKMNKVDFSELGEDMLIRLSRVTYKLISIKPWDYLYLVMDNPSIQHKHIEGVPAGTKNVIAAIRWRNQTETLPKELS